MAFTLNAFAAFAMSTCVCSEMMQMEMEMEMSNKDMSCHDTVDADANTAQIDQDRSKLTKCENCCENCKAPMQTSVLNNKAETAFFLKNIEPISFLDMNSSIYPYDIDHPPKHIS